MMNRKWLPTFAELIDRLSIYQLKEVFIPENKATYANEMNDIAHDLDLMIKENNLMLSADLIHAIVVLSQMNAHIWYNEANARKGGQENLSNLKLTHGINGVRNKTMNAIKVLCNEENRLDLKTDCLAAEFDDWDVSLLKKI